MPLISFPFRILWLYRTSYADVSQTKGTNRMKTLGMNRILLVSTPTLNQWYNLEKQFPECGLLTPGNPLRPIQESFEVITVFKVILRHCLSFSLTFALIQKQHLIKLLQETLYLLENVLDEAVKIISFIKFQPFSTCLFNL